MTSAPNHRQPSNGSKFPNSFALLFFSALLLFSSGCELFKPIDNGGGSTVGRDRPRDNDRTKPANDDNSDNTIGDIAPIQSRRVFDPETGRYIYVSNAPTQEMDTVRWKLVREDVSPPITEVGTDVFEPVIDPNTSGNNANSGNQPTEQLGVGENGSRLLSTYNIDFMLPFLANRLLNSDPADNSSLPEIDDNSQWALHFYSGAQMALDDLRDSGISLNVNAQDTKATPQETSKLLRSPAVQGAQMLIGPYLRNNVAAAAEAVRNQEKVLVSPYSAADGISNDNPNYIQVNPTLNTHMRNLLQHAISTKRGDRIVLVGKPEYQDRLSFLQEEYKVMVQDVNVAPLDELLITEPTTDLTSFLDGRGTVFIVPEFGDESFVANFLRQVYEANRMNNDRVAVYGLPQWKNFSRVDFDYYEGTNVHISSSVFIDLLNPTIRKFRQDFFNRFKAIPREEAYVGYDLTHYFARMISQHGTRFQFALPRFPEAVMTTEFRFEPMMLVNPNANGFEQSTVDHWENTFVNILRFQDYQFKKVN